MLVQGKQTVFTRVYKFLKNYSCFFCFTLRILCDHRSHMQIHYFTTNTTKNHVKLIRVASELVKNLHIIDLVVQYDGFL